MIEQPESLQVVLDELMSQGGPNRAGPAGDENSLALDGFGDALVKMAYQPRPSRIPVGGDPRLFSTQPKQVGCG